MLLSDASACNSWTSLDTSFGQSLRAEYVPLLTYPRLTFLTITFLLPFSLQYTLPVDGAVFVRSNISSYNTTADPMTMLVVNGTLDIDINDDPSAKDAVVSVTMLYPNAQLRDSTNVCLMSVSDGNGLYLFVSSQLISVYALSLAANDAWLCRPLRTSHTQVICSSIYPSFCPKTAPLSCISLDWPQVYRISPKTLDHWLNVSISTRCSLLVLCQA